METPQRRGDFKKRAKQAENAAKDKEQTIQDLLAAEKTGYYIIVARTASSAAC